MFAADNYASVPYSSAYDLEQFSVERTQRAVSAALDSPASLRSVSKHFNHRLIEDEDDRTMRAKHVEENSMLRKGQTIVQKPVYDAEGNTTGTVLEEGVSESRRDNLGNTACANCGSPKNLKLCSGCRQKFFCSRSCQRVSLSWRQRLARNVHLVL